MRDELGVRFEQVLLGLRFPAQRWQILAHADLSGVDAFTRHLIHRKPSGLYRDCTHVVTTIVAMRTNPNSTDLRSPGHERSPGGRSRT